MLTCVEQAIRVRVLGTSFRCIVEFAFVDKKKKISVPIVNTYIGEIPNTVSFPPTLAFNVCIVVDFSPKFLELTTIFNLPTKTYLRKYTY